jgi:type IV pilus assembly protein PilO
MGAGHAILRCLEATGPMLRRQFTGLDPRDPAAWPRGPRLLLCAGLAALTLTVLWFARIASTAQALAELQAQEAQLKSDYTRKVAQAVHLLTLRRQRDQVQAHVTALERQLPGRAEMDALLSDINQAGLSRSLVFELFRPGQVVLRDHYAELPIAIKVSGRYHDIGAFVADVAHLSRIVTLNNLAITPHRDGLLVMEATAKTFRDLDLAESAARRPPGPAAGPVPRERS